MKLNISHTSDEQVTAICEHLKSYITESKKERITLAVSGGKSPIALLQKLSQMDLPWHNIDITLVDDRFIDETNIDSNAHLVKRYLLQNNAEVANFIHLISDENNIENSISNANNAIKNIDIAILGMGEDGHTASIFPDCPELINALETQQTYIITNPQNAKYQRIGLSMHALKKIPCLILSINGKIKHEVLIKANLQKDLHYPISYLLESRNDIQVYWHE